ncbi:hypothetical protein IQ07DRAFT_578368 [Pyrenochaeta sp. DS3sAY3a]|nr:hypothetical protein IQ07DRAFT_578368 [Pyrenochaeta sp. DS3sAY3a]
MSSDSGESRSSAHQDEPDEIDVGQGLGHVSPDPREPPEDNESVQQLQTEVDPEDEGASSNGDIPGLTFARTRRSFPQQFDQDSASELSFRPRLERPGSPESTSIPDDTPSIQGSGLSSPGSSVPVSHNSLRAHRPTHLQPFERRFSSRLSPSPLSSPRAQSPAFLSPHSRQSSVSSQLILQQLSDGDGTDTPQAPWEVVRWTKLKKITGQVFSEVGKRNFGRPTCLNVTVSLVIGTSKGFILVFDYQQVLKSIIGPGTKAVECGAITALAISADHSTVAGGHATGHIFTWELAKPAKPFLHIPPLDRATLDDKKSDGHVSGVAILHLGFLGTRHTALVSADDGGMAFSHLATRGLGAIARSVKTTRILGRYPLSAKSLEKPRKPSSVLAFSPLPLGNVEQPTDDMGLTALLTPYLLVIVSTTPVAQTQHKAPRPKDVAPHSTLSGCLAWFPAVKLKNPSNDPGKAVSKTKLAYCWSNILTILDVDSIVAPASEKEKPTELRFRPRSRWKADEAIAAVQWLSRSVLGVLTISQRLIILEDNSLRMTDSFDLLQKNIYHSDLFSRQLRPVIEQLDEQDNSMHGVVANAFYMSFRAYKGRLFILGFNDVAIGTLSNWADRLVALMEEGDFIAAIGLATSYYVGDADKLTVGLPEDDKARHTLVREKLFEMIAASLKYTFSRDDEGQESREPRLKELAEVAFTGLLSMKELDFLFEDVYDAFEEGSAEKPFFETLEPYILDDEITAVPPNVLKDLITFYASANRASRLEEMICRLSTDTMDINQVTTLCQQYFLYDALIYVWTRAIGDYITPLTNIIALIKLVDFEVDEEENVYMSSAKKIFPYLAYTFTGRVYPGGTFMDDEQALNAKRDMYRFLFAGKNLQWPPGSGEVILTKSTKGAEPPFPYLQLVLEFDASSFMSMLNEAFEDSFLNGEQDLSNGNHVNGAQHDSAHTPTRQYIIGVLFGIMTIDNFDPEDIIYFYMFIARNLPKYPQHIMLPGSSLHQVLVGLCEYPTEIIKEDCQLSVEYLLSVYHPPNPQNLVPLFEKAGFHRVLKFVYRGAHQYAKLLETFLDDANDEEAVFDCLRDILNPSKGLIKKQLNEVKAVVANRAADLAAIDPVQTALTLKQHAPDLLEVVLEAIEDDSDSQYHYLEALIEPKSTQDQVGQIALIDESLPSGFIAHYVRLMCTYNSAHVADFVSMLKSGDLQLSSVLPALEQSGVIDAAVILLARDGLVKDAMDRLIKHLGTLETALTGLIAASADSPDVANSEEAVHDLLEDIQKYVKVGIWLCQGQTRTVEGAAQSVAETRKSAYGEVSEADLALDEILWLDLVDTVVRLIRQTSRTIADLDALPTTDNSETIDTARIVSTLRTSVQQTFSSLLAATTIPPAKKNTPTSAELQSQPTRPPLYHTTSQAQSNPSFLRILRCFLTRAARTYSPSLSHLRSVLAEIFAAYTFEETILSLANRFLDKESFEHVHEITELRKRGWRPRGQVCEGCRKRAWGPGAGASVWEEWEKREQKRTRQRLEEAPYSEDSENNGAKGKGKRPSQAHIHAEPEDAGEKAGTLVLFACRHLWHKQCLEKAKTEEGDEEGARGRGHGHGHGHVRLRCPICRE